MTAQAKLLDALMLAHESLAALEVAVVLDEGAAAPHTIGRLLVNSLVAHLSRPTVAEVEGVWVATVPGMEWVRVERQAAEEAVLEAKRQAEESLGGRV